MIVSIKLAYRNLIRGGLRTWLNVIVLSFAFVLIIFYNSFINGWQQQARLDGIAWEYGYGQLHFKDYEPGNPFTYSKAHGVLPVSEQDGLTPVLIRQVTLYPKGRMMPVVAKGIDPHQETLKIPTASFLKTEAELPAIIGKRMAEAASLKVGDQLIMRWRDKNDTFDASTITIVAVFNTTVSTIDNGQIWLPITKLWDLTGLKHEASMWIAGKEFQNTNNPDWKFHNLQELLKDLNAAVAMERAWSMLLFLVLLSLGLLVIFDTQALSIFRRQREIGTWIALGMTRKRLLTIFTTEGCMYGIFAMALGAVYGVPFFLYTAKVGIGLPEGIEGMGIAIANRIYPVYSPGVILGTIVLVAGSATLVSFLPARKIAKMNPVNALKGKML